MNLSFLPNKRLAVILHIAAWIIILIIPLYMLGSGAGKDINFLLRIYSHLIAYAVLFYINFIWLIPQFFFKNKRKWYFVTAVTAIISLYFLVEVTNRYIIPQGWNKAFEKELNQLLIKNNIQPPSHNIHNFNFLITSIMVCGFSLGLKQSDKYFQNEKERKELEKERLNTELAFLKNQISPHFFFNTLNNIYSLIEINKDDAQQSVLKLSKLMRYLLYESEQGDTTLAHEIDFMRNYIDLMRLRLSDKVELTASFPDANTHATIPPLLFVSFVENAFKHGISYRDKSFIHIALVNTDVEIIFTCSNSIFKQNDDSNQGKQGLGLENVKKRLALLYPGTHELQISSENNVFSAMLKLKNS